MSQHPTEPPITEEHLADLLASRSNTSPVPILKHKAENSVRRQLKDVAIKGCAFHVRALAECTDGKIISVIWHCRHLSKAIDSCMRQFGDDELLKDEMRRRHGVKFPSAVKGYRQPSTPAPEQDMPV